MQVPIDQIIVKKRIRKDLGDLGALMDSLRRFGLMNPVLINRKNVLVAGGRRLHAAKELGWKTINAIVIEASDELTRLEYEIEENVQRREFSEEETTQAWARLYTLRNPGFFRRLWNALVAFFKKLFRIKD